MLGLRKVVGFKNSAASTASPGATVLRNGAMRINDVQYGVEYPNSFLDIYIADNDPTTRRPTFVYVHGGGFVVGDKVSGDPAAKGIDGFSIVSDPILAAGFNLVSFDYALAPEFKYPVPLIQLSQAVAFLQEHGAEHGIDMSELIVGGGSAGGHIAAQFGLVESDPVYAARVGILPVTHGTLKALALDSAPFDMDRVGKTQPPKFVPSVLFSLALRTYLGRQGLPKTIVSGARQLIAF